MAHVLRVYRAVGGRANGAGSLGLPHHGLAVPGHRNLVCLHLHPPLMVVGVETVVTYEHKNAMWLNSKVCL